MSQAKEILAPQYAFGREASCCELIALLDPSSKALALVQSCASLPIHDSSLLNTLDLLPELPHIGVTIPGRCLMQNSMIDSASSSNRMFALVMGPGARDSASAVHKSLPST